MAARLLALVGAVLMPVSLFLDWYRIDTGVFTRLDFSADGWAVFETTDAVMVLTAVTALVLVVTAPRYLARALIAVGTIATAFIVVQLIDKPPAYGLFDVPGLSLETGAWLGLAGALAILAAGFLVRAADSIPDDEPPDRAAALS